MLNECLLGLLFRIDLEKCFTSVSVTWYLCLVTRSESKMLVNLKNSVHDSSGDQTIYNQIPNFCFQKCCMRLHSATLVSDMTIYSYDSLVTMRWSPDHSPEPSHGSPLSVEGQRPPVSGVSLRLLVRPWWHRGLQAESGQQVRPARPQETLQPGRRDGDW